MGDTCSLCGSDKDVQLVGEIHMCASCQGKEVPVDFHLEFTKWAVEHGKITDFPGQIDELYVQTHQGS